MFHVTLLSPLPGKNLLAGLIESNKYPTETALTMSNFRRSGSFNLSPRKNFVTPISVVTPSTRRQSFTTPASPILIDGSGNNDEAERRERQLNRLQQLQSRGVHSPTGTPADRRKSLGTFTGLTNQQLTEHYAKCIQLSAENKINVKNAFNLQLIDYMTELLKRKDSDMNNFQMASCTLDASTKIYSCRVDSVHTDTLKMAGGLGRTKDKPEGNPGDVQGDDEYENQPRGKKRVKSKKCATIESNLKNLDVAHFDLAFDVDPLFKKTATQFDEGTAGGGQFLNTLQFLDERSQLVLDSDAVLTDLERGKQKNDNEATLVLAVPEIDSKVICKTFLSFEFTTWKLSDDSFRDSMNPQRENENEHAFDINAVPEPLDEQEQEPFEVDDMANIPGDDNIEMEEDNTVITIGGDMACKQSDRAPPPQLEVIHLKHYLSENPLEYSYFDSRVMSAWAGPGHWKLKPLIKGKESCKEGNKLREKQRKEFSLDFCNDPEIEKQFAKSRAATKLSQLTVKKWSIHNDDNTFRFTL
ncbi:Condensin complex subunit 2 [Armadillidium nasatum]|uniref:Condensin complex subunit 2 n=1 Tax=Armadillidium nasatum TaxID=96803 RepID=A0A5N5SQR7_9CRUS|nr:Condensin complex subunit 2 [Armadillidium nasatum]